jgi:hypothetical protein
MMKHLILATTLFFGAAHATEPQTYLGIIVAYQDGKVIASQSIGFAETLGDCLKGVTEFMSQLTPKPGISFLPFCPLAPSAPPKAI